MKQHTKVTLVLISTLFVSSLATAADSAMKMPMNNPSMDCNGIRMMPGNMGTNPEVRAKIHLSELNSRLNLTKAQQPDWEIFSSKVNDQARHMAVMQDMNQTMTKSAPEHMAMMAKTMNTHAMNMSEMADTVKVFYVGLSTGQQAAFDKVQMGYMHNMVRTQ